SGINKTHFGPSLSDPDDLPARFPLRRPENAGRNDLQQRVRPLLDRSQSADDGAVHHRNRTGHAPRTGNSPPLSGRALRPQMMLGAHMLCGAFVFLVIALILTVFGWAFYEEAPKYPESVAAALLPSILALFPSGMFVTSLARDNRSAAAIGFLLLNRMLFLSGATFSTERMPSYLPTSAKILPPASWWNCLHKTWNKATLQDKSVHVAVLAAIANVSGIPAARFFRREDCAFLGPGPGSVDKQNNALYNIFLAVRRS